MHSVPRFWANDEELAKKNDDLSSPRNVRRNSQWQGAVRTPRRSSVFRLVLFLCAAFVVVFILSRRFGPSSHGRTLPLNTNLPPPNNAAPNANPKTVPANPNEDPVVDPNKGPTHPPRFLELPQTLHKLAGMQGKQAKNRNVLFAAASLKSASTLLPIACQMAQQKKNFVHFTFIGRDTISMQGLLKMNGLLDQCPMILHDARPDQAAESPWTRMRTATFQAMHHMETFVHPQAVIIDSTLDEESFFLTGLRAQLRNAGSALIELPNNPIPSLSWITQLDSASLSVFNKIRIDILVQAPPNGSGNLDRLLRSLSRLDLTLALPHLTIELPSKVDPQVERILADFEWPPPGTAAGGQKADMLSLRRRIPREKLTEEESSIRYLESFWPRNPSHSYVLVLSPHAEVNPQFLHYVKYALLHYGHCNAANLQEWGRQMMGISLSSPSTLLDGLQTLSLPEPSEDAGESFLWQAPDSDAMLYSGDKWVELHGYISQLLERQASADPPAALAQKDVSKTRPAWLEYALQLAKLRGYTTLYPGKETAGVIFGSHNDIPDVPEEYQDDQEAREAAEAARAEDEATDSFDSIWAVDMLQTLPLHGSLPFLTRLPVLTWDGQGTTMEDLESKSKKLAAQFRSDVGGCAEDTALKKTDKYARDLFCKQSDGSGT